MFMSTTYPDYPHTHFPDDLTDEARGYKQDVKDVQTAQLIQEYQTQFTLGNTGKCHDILVANPELQEMMWKADDYNWIRDAIMALERFYSEDVTATMEQMALLRRDLEMTFSRDSRVISITDILLIKSILCLKNSDMNIE